MPGKNSFFERNSNRARFARAFYSRLLTRKPFKIADALADSGVVDEKGNVVTKEDVAIYKVSFYMNRLSLKHVPTDVVSLVESVAGKESVKIDGPKKSQTYCYVGDKPDPLQEVRKESFINSTKRYLRFCKNSAGFFPSVWLDYFFAGTKDLLEMRGNQKRGGQVLFSSADRELTNIELLPKLYDWIIRKKVLSLTYASHYGKPEVLTVHPHYLKEFNDRWFLIGYVDEKGDEDSLSIDRIQNPSEVDGADFRTAEPWVFDVFFKNMIGVSFTKGETEPVKVVFKAHGEYMFGLIRTKPVHRSQKLEAEYDKEQGFGVFSVCVIPNKEFYGRLMSKGASLEVVSPENVRNEMARKVSELAERYK